MYAVLGRRAPVNPGLRLPRLGTEVSSQHSTILPARLTGRQVIWEEVDRGSKKNTVKWKKEEANRLLSRAGG